MKLFFRKYGKGEPIVIVHGLYGSSDNWVSIAKELASDFEVFIIDQRNHGQSPHSEEFNYDILAGDLLEFMNTQNLKSAILIGHSLGGKAIMQFATQYHTKVNNLIVIDIAPKSYRYSLSNKFENLNHKQIIEALLSVNINEIKSRKEIDKKLSSIIKERRLRLFLLKNLKRKKDKSFYWTLNFKEINNNLKLIMEDVSFELFESVKINIPTLFIRGENSNYILDEDIEKIKKIFTNSEINTIKDASHWVHAEKPKELIESIRKFIVI